MTSDFSDHQKKVLSNLERQKAIYPKRPPSHEIFEIMQQAPFDGGKVARRFADLYENNLVREEFHRALHGNEEQIPVLAPEKSILVGYTDSHGREARIALNDVTSHIGIGGNTGSGKTTLLAQLTSRLLQHAKVLLFDAKNEAGRYLKYCPGSVYIPPERLRWNPLSGAGNQRDYLRFFSTQLGRIAGLLPNTRNAVMSKLFAMASDRSRLPAIADLVPVFDVFAKKEGRINFQTASKVISDLSAAMSDWAKVRQGSWVLDDYPLCVMPIRGIPSAYRNFIISLINRYSTDQAIATGHTTDLRRVYVFEEARDFFGIEQEAAASSGGINLQTELIILGRTLGNAVVVASQSLSKIQPAVLENCGTLFVFRTGSDVEAKLCCRHLRLPEKRHPEIMNLNAGEAFFITPQYSQGVKIRIPYVDLGAYPAELDILQSMHPIYEAWDAKTIFCPTRTETEEAIDFREILGETSPKTEPSAESNEPPQKPVEPAPTPSFFNTADPAAISDYLAMLRSITAHSDFGVTDHYRALGFSGGRGTRIKSKLLELGWVTTESVVSPKGGRPTNILKLTETGKGVLNDKCA